MHNDSLIGVELGGFRVRRKIAEGGMGIVYEGFHEALGRRAAIKVLKPEVAADSEWTHRFLTEARAVGALKHRNLIEVLNFGKTPDGREFLMMEFLDGQPLDHAMRGGSLPIPVALGIAEQIANGLSEAHKKGIVHRDLKPSNVHLLKEHSGETLVKVLDFGLARQDPVSLFAPGSMSEVKREGASSLMAGTPEYIAPEQAQGKRVEVTADIYSLGIILFEMTAGELPFKADSINELLLHHLQTPPPALSTLVDGLPHGLEALVDSMLAKDPADRPASADIVRLELQRLLKSLSQEATAVRRLPVSHPSMPAAATTRVERARTPRRWVAVALAAAAAVTGVAIALSFGGQPQPQPQPQPAPLVAPAPPPEPLQPVLAKIDVPPPAPVEPAPPPTAPQPDLERTTPGPRVTPPIRPARGCVPDAEWKQRLTLDVAEMGTVKRVLEDARLYDVWDQKQGQLSAAIASARTPSQCAQAQAAYDSLRERLGFR